MNIEDILIKYGSYGRTGRVLFSPYAYILVCNEIGIDYSIMTQNDKIFLKSEMIDEYAGTGSINEEYWRNKYTPVI